MSYYWVYLQTLQSICEKSGMMNQTRSQTFYYLKPIITFYWMGSVVDTSEKKFQSHWLHYYFKTLRSLVNSSHLDNYKYLDIKTLNLFASSLLSLKRSSSPLKLNRWHRVRVTRTGLLAEVQVNDRKRVAQLAAGAFTQVTFFSAHTLCNYKDLSTKFAKIVWKTISSIFSTIPISLLCIMGGQ